MDGIVQRRMTAGVDGEKWLGKAGHIIADCLFVFLSGYSVTIFLS